MTRYQLAFALAFCMPVSSPALADLAQDCVVAEALYEERLDIHASQGGPVTSAIFATLSDGEKWHWVASKLLAQSYRMTAVVQNPSAQPIDWITREAQIMLELDAVEPCFREAAGPYVNFTKIPSDEWRANLRVQMENLL